MYGVCAAREAECGLHSASGWGCCGSSGVLGGPPRKDPLAVAQVVKRGCKQPLCCAVPCLATVAYELCNTRTLGLSR